MNKLAVSAAITALAMAAAGSANAAVQTFFDPTVGAPTAGYTIFDNFNSLLGVTGTGTFGLSSTSTGTGADPAEVPAPPPPYLDVEGGANVSVDFTVLLPTTPVHAFEFDWGSVDTFNTLTIHVLGGPDKVIIPPAPGNGSWTSGDTNGTFMVWGTAGETFTGITLASTQDSFEIDDLAIRGVPEPASWAMMIMGFGAIGFAMRRRSRMVAAV